MSTMILNNGAELPQLGYGTILQFGDQIIDNVAFALNTGYKLIDTANRYGNEAEVGRGLKNSGLNRADYLLETKLGPTLYENDDAIDGTLKRLGVDYLDVMLLHHPVNNYIYAYKMLEKAYKAGKIRAIGISNFPAEKILEVVEKCDVVPALMQVECHPYFPAELVKPTCDRLGIKLQAWYPLGHGDASLINDPAIKALAEKHGKTTAQVILRWHVQMGFGFVPGSKSHVHIKENAEIFDFALTGEEMEAVAALNKHKPFFKVTPESLQRLATTKCNFEE